MGAGFLLAGKDIREGVPVVSWGIVWLEPNDQFVPAGVVQNLPCEALNHAGICSDGCDGATEAVVFQPLLVYALNKFQLLLAEFLVCFDDRKIPEPDRKQCDQE